MAVFCEKPEKLEAFKLAAGVAFGFHRKDDDETAKQPTPLPPCSISKWNETITLPGPFAFSLGGLTSLVGLIVNPKKKPKEPKQGLRVQQRSIIKLLQIVHEQTA